MKSEELRGQADMPARESWREHRLNLLVSPPQMLERAGNRFARLSKGWLFPVRFDLTASIPFDYAQSRAD